jgi:hypothetical protein
VVLAVLAIVWTRMAPPTPGGIAGPLAIQSHDANAGPNQPATMVASKTPASTSKTKGPSTAYAKTETGAGTSRQPSDRGLNAPQFPMAVSPPHLQLLVPAYIYPVGDGRKEWLRLIEAASKVKIVAIINPDSGPGEERNLEYDTIYTEASRHGVTLVGYVSTKYAARPLDEIKSDVDRWVRLYPQVRGFFFDQQPREGRHAALYRQIREYAQQKVRDALVITNPGVPCDEAYLADEVSNVTCVFQNYDRFDEFELTAALKGYQPSRFAALPYNIADAESMRALIKDAIRKRIGYLYISDAKPPNYWNTLPRYWEVEVDAVSHLD